MDVQAIFGVQFLLSLVVWSVVLGAFAGPWLAEKSLPEVLLWLTLPHAFRHMGLVFLVPGVIDQPLPAEFAGPAAYGDLAAGVLALATILALRTKGLAALPLVWLFNVVGTVDLVNALRHIDIAPLLGAAWFIPTAFVPLLLATHFLIFRRLFAHAGSRAAAPAALEA